MLFGQMPPLRPSGPGSSGFSAVMSRHKWPSSSSRRGNSPPSSVQRASSSPTLRASRAYRNPCRLESLPPPRVIGMLNSFFTAATSVVDERGGVVVNYIGDALIAAFNAPLPAEDHPARAVDVARDLLSLVSGREFKGHQLRLRIGAPPGRWPTAPSEVRNVTPTRSMATP
jgi:Adenylate and Guanylate cyclase catalytic domain